MDVECQPERLMATLQWQDRNVRVTVECLRSRSYMFHSSVSPFSTNDGFVVAIATKEISLTDLVSKRDKADKVASISLGD